MLDLSSILLAQSHDDGPGRFIGILIFIAIFIFGNVLQWWQKYQAQQRKLEAQRRATAAATPPVMQRPTQRSASQPAGSYGVPAHMRPAQAKPRPGVMQRPAAAARAIPGVRRLITSLPSLPGVNLPPRRPVPPAAHPVPVRKALQPRPEMPRPAEAATQEITASQIGSRAPSAPNRADRIRSIFNARSLKQVYILTELLRPPVALRDPTSPEA